MKKRQKKSGKSSKEDKSIPIEVILIAILGFLAAIFLFIISTAFFSTFSIIGSSSDLVIEKTIEKLKSDPNYPQVELGKEQFKEYLNQARPIFLFLGSLGIIFMIIYLVSSIFLLKGRNWARLTHIILALFFILFSLLILISPLFILGFLSLIINSLIVGYLLFNKKTKNYFS